MEGTTDAGSSGTKTVACFGNIPVRHLHDVKTVALVGNTPN